uniref:Retinoic acid-induced protein 3-like n=1 Tax=Geotrypetes seraphini TaxID=260995 RepID=A0A6P8QF08_GEOSA|nr:retinoic acid-induced protein 3-like [Geotrypetes seraphini]XP_033785366.1 retinoic acid-induced protein 3-like [Geotrypetes seraphini]
MAGCGSNLALDYRFLCDRNAAWGIVLETLAAAGIVTTIFLLFVLFCLIPRIANFTKRSIVPIQIIFLLGTLGIFGLTFAFIIQLNAQTCPTRFFLFGVLFAICFSCLLVHAFKLVGLVRCKQGMNGCLMLLGVFALSMVQVIIAIIWVVIELARNKMPCNFLTNTDDEFIELNKNFVYILIYVLFLMALTFIVSMVTFCGSNGTWKIHGVHIFLTMFLSICIWIVWIVMLLRGNRDLHHGHWWDDPVISIALVSNGWVFIIFYLIPEFIHLTRNPVELIKECAPTQPHLLRQPGGVENRVFGQDDCQDEDSGRCFPSSQPRFDALPMKDLEDTKEFTIPRPHPVPWVQYRTHDITLPS